MSSFEGLWLGREISMKYHVEGLVIPLVVCLFHILDSLPMFN